MIEQPFDVAGDLRRVRPTGHVPVLINCRSCQLYVYLLTFSPEPHELTFIVAEQIVAFGPFSLFAVWSI